MTARKLPLESLPDWPRLLERDKAAAYLGISPNTLDEIPVRRVKIKSRTLWDRRALDDFADRLDHDGGDAPPNAMHLLDQLAAGTIIHATASAPQNKPRRPKRHHLS